MPRQRRDVPWLDTREGGVYYAFWYDPDTRRTRRHSLNTKVPGEAALAFATFLQHGADVYRSRAAGLTCGQALQDYLREHIAEKYVDKKRPRGTIANLSEHFGSLEVSKVELQHQWAYRDRRLRGEIGTKPAKLSTVRPVLRRAVRLAEQYSGEGMRQNDAHRTRMDIASGISGLDR